MTTQQPPAEPRGPMSEQEMIEQIKTIMDANTLIDAMRTAAEWKALVSLKPVIWTDSAGALHVAPLTVRQTMQVIAALEGLKVQ